MNPKEQEFQVEIKQLMKSLVQGDGQGRKDSLTRLRAYEKSARMTLELLLEFSKSQEASQAMYAIAALGRNRSPEAVARLLALLEAHQNQNPLFLECILNALEEAGDPSAAPALLRLLGVNTWRRLFKGKTQVINLKDLPQARKSLRLAIIRALENTITAKQALGLGVFLHDEDPLVRWHTIHLMIQSRCTEFLKDISYLAKNDDSEVVQEKAKIALDAFQASPAVQVVN